MLEAFENGRRPRLGTMMSALAASFVSTAYAGAIGRVRRAVWPGVRHCCSAGRSRAPCCVRRLAVVVARTWGRLC
eukprot:tig00000204_g17778.t1